MINRLSLLPGGIIPGLAPPPTGAGVSGSLHAENGHLCDRTATNLPQVLDLTWFEGTETWSMEIRIGVLM